MLNLSYSHSFDVPGGGTLVPAISTHIESSFWLGEEYHAGERQGSATVTDFDLTWTSAEKRFSVTGYVQNIKDNAVGQSAFLQPTIVRALVYPISTPS